MRSAGVDWAERAHDAGSVQDKDIWGTYIASEPADLDWAWLQRSCWRRSVAQGRSKSAVPGCYGASSRGEGKDDAMRVTVAMVAIPGGKQQGVFRKMEWRIG
eukprot:1067432-Rhodomonas_salina.2